MWDWTRRTLRFNSIPLSQGESGIGQLAHFISLVLSPSHNSSALSQGKRDGIVRSLSVPSRSLSIREHSHSLQGECGIGQLAHFISLVLSPSLKEREGWDGSVTFCSFAALRVTAGGRNP